MSKRLNSVECLRVLIMLFIVIHHCVVSGLGLNNTLNAPGGDLYNKDTIILSAINTFVIVGVNVFFLISGYFGIKCNIKKVLRLFGEIVFYSSSIYIICLLLGKTTFSPKLLLDNTIFSITQYWFMEVYIVLIFISRYINEYMDMVLKDKNKSRLLILTLFCILCIYGFVFKNSSINVNSGYSLIYAIMLYIVGRYIRFNECHNKVGKLNLLFIYLATAIVNCIGVIILLRFEKGGSAWQMFSYNNPLILFEAVALFMLFLKLRCENIVCKVIGFWGKNVLGVYLIHSCSLMHPYRFKLLVDYFEQHSLSVLLIVCYCIMLFAICLCIDKIRATIVKYVMKYICKNNSLV